jgi:predicted phosphodiesterase
MTETRILAVSDEVSNVLYSSCRPESLGRIDLIIGCGDLVFDYMEFLVDAFDRPFFYVFGNHDDKGLCRSDGTFSTAPEGPENVEGRLVRHRDIRIAGLGGSIRHSSRSTLQYSQRQMWRRVLRLSALLLLHGRKDGRFLDIFVAHSPVTGIHEGPDPVHKGFDAFRWLLHWARPAWMLHGHTQFTIPSCCLRQTLFESTLITYIPPYQVLTWNPKPLL